MNKLTGDKNINFMILMKLNHKELSMVCSVNKYVNELCKDDTFWFNRVLLTFNFSPLVAREMKTYLQFDNWKEFYVWLQEGNFEPGRVNIIAKSLDKKEVIDRIIEIFKKMRLKKWINPEEFYKAVRRYAFINAQDELNKDYEHDEDQDEDNKIVFKTLNSFERDELFNIFIHGWYDTKEKLQN